MSYNGPNKFHSVSTKFNGDQFAQLIRKEADGFENMIMLLDNAKIHTKGVQYLKNIGITVMDFPPKSNDMNVIENVFAELQKSLNKNLRGITVSTKKPTTRIDQEMLGRNSTRFHKKMRVINAKPVEWSN